MKKQIQISVIIPAHDRTEMLKEAVDSVLAQTYQDFELIVIDNGSQENISAMLKENYGGRVKVFRQEDLGVSGARNRGIKEAAGVFIAFLDSDDLWLPAKLSAQIEFFHTNLNALICQTEEIWIRKGVRVNPKKRHKKLSGMIFEPSLALCLVSPSAVMIKKSLFDQAGTFDENLPACEDYDLWLRISCEHPIYLIDKPLIIKRGGHPDQLSLAFGLDKFRIISLNKIINSGILNEEQSSQARRMLLQKCEIYKKGCAKRKRTDEIQFIESIQLKYKKNMA